MANIVLNRWIEPYVLLETLKSHYEMKDWTFDGWTKQAVKVEFLKSLSKVGTVGLYMKNVNKFYLFYGCENLNVKALFNLQDSDCSIEENTENALSRVDMGKSEAAFINI